VTTAERNTGDSKSGSPAAMLDHTVRLLTASDGLRTFLLASAAIGLALAVTGLLILVAGKNPIAAYWALIKGVTGTTGRFAFALNKSTPYILAGVGVALCFRAKVINIGAEGQIAVGAIAATWIALNMLALPPVLQVTLALASGATGGAAWSALAAIIRLKRGVHEVLCTLLLNFVGVLLVSEALHGRMGESGAGFPQSPLLERSAWLPNLLPDTDLHIGIVFAILAVIGGYILLWRTTFGFRLRVMGASPKAANYAGIAAPRCMLGVMTLAGALAGFAGSIEVLGVHYRLIEGFSAGFGFNAVAVALIASINPIAVFPAGLFFGFLEAGALAMQREVGVPSSLVFVIQGLTMVFVLCAIGIGARAQRV
jgi:general nucleoside transport system permease protein